MISIKREMIRVQFFSLILFGVLINVSTLLSFSEKQQKELRQIIDARNPNLNYGICFMRPDGAQPEFARHANRLFIPASNTKLFIAVAALHTLGKDYCFETNLLTDGHQEGKILFGSIYLKAVGDPSFTSEDLKNLIAQLKSKGFEIIKGNFCLDITQFSDDASEYFGHGYSIDNFGEPWNAPITSLIINNNTLKLTDGILRALNDPHQYALCEIEKLLTEFGITYSGKIITMASPKKELTIVAQHKSEPLSALAAHMLKASDNLYANVFFKLLGSHDNNEPGSWQRGEDSLKVFLHDQIGIDPDTINIVDGAGLSRYNLISPNHVIRLLDWVYHQTNLYPLFSDCLAIAGRDGTLKNRMSRYTGMVKAKTGSLQGISALSGYICLPDHEPIIFSILLNNFVQPQNDNTKIGIDYKRDVEDELCAQVIAFEREYHQVTLNQTSD